MTMAVFDRRAVRRHRDRAAAGFARHDFLLAEVAARLNDRLDDVKRTFHAALDLGAHVGGLRDLVAARPGMELVVACEPSPAMTRELGGAAVAADEELLPFADGAFDLVVSGLSLHWVNDLPGALVQIRRALKPDGLFLAAMLGGNTLEELRAALAEAEIAAEGGLSPRVSPFADVRDAGDLLQRAGFALPVVDSDTITVSYGDPAALMNDLRGMGESNAVVGRRKTWTRRATLEAAAERYREMFGDSAGRIPATFHVITLTAWAPHPSQQKPLKPGSARTRLAEALGTVEIPAGEKAKPR